MKLQHSKNMKCPNFIFEVAEDLGISFFVILQRDKKLKCPNLTFEVGFLMLSGRIKVLIK